MTGFYSLAPFRNIWRIVRMMSLTFNVRSTISQNIVYLVHPSSDWTVGNSIRTVPVVFNLIKVKWVSNEKLRWKISPLVEQNKSLTTAHFFPWSLWLFARFHLEEYTNRCQQKLNNRSKNNRNSLEQRSISYQCTTLWTNQVDIEFVECWNKNNLCFLSTCFNNL